MSAARLSNPLALAVLALLEERPMHPYEMSTTLRERHKEDSIKLNYGSLYSVVASLQKYGLITVQETVREGNRPERTIYAITQAGRVKMAGWLSELISTPAREFTGFEAALSLMGALPPDEVTRLLDIRLASLRAKQSSLEAVLASLGSSLPRIFTIEVEFQNALLVAETDFVHGLLHELKTDQLSGTKFWRRMHELRATDASPQQIDEALRAEFAADFAWMEDAEGQP
ncbi:MAG TPA: helix-turn-helix transcriptional regulator [Kineosporiaceae bacterium]|nr:helix-turn-helix transcriptional regulator [Kineosporiaceae bacterium]